MLKFTVMIRTRIARLSRQPATYLYTIPPYMYMILMLSHNEINHTINIPKCLTAKGSLLHTYEPVHGKTNEKTYAQQRLRSAWAFAQSDQSLHCCMKKAWVLRRYVPFERIAKTDQTLGPMGAVPKNDVH